ncbi:MAG TPA: hypothetical protein VL346_12680 [Acidobacteriaceae bacterium]|nr:hypothetical protein [Acidobacteriaceae bacterium]
MPDTSAASTSSTSLGSAETPQDGATRMERIAASLYHIASMLLGDGEDAIRLVEKAIGEASSSPQDAAAALRSLHWQIASDAISLLASRNPDVLAAPEVDLGGPVSCIEGDELDAAGVTSAELEAMLTGPDNAHLRAWIESLPISLRVTFVLRAIAGLGSAEVAGLLADFGGPAAENWTPAGVRTIFRQALCSLAAQLLHATAEL